MEYEDAVKLVAKGVKLVLEGANMPSTPDAIHHFRKTSVILAAAKACNAGVCVCVCYVGVGVTLSHLLGGTALGHIHVVDRQGLPTQARHSFGTLQGMLVRISGPMACQEPCLTPGRVIGRVIRTNMPRAMSMRSLRLLHGRL